MPWVKIDNTLPDHPKIVAAGHDGLGLFIAAICYCGRYATDGFVPDAQIGRLTTLDSRAEAKAMQKLVDVKLAHKVDGGYQIHDYLDHQMAKEKIEESREKTRRRVAKFRSGNAPVTPLHPSDVTRDVTPPVTPLVTRLDVDIDIDLDNPPNDREKTPPLGVDEAIIRSGIGR